jgi:hypothetical protein
VRASIGLSAATRKVLRCREPVVESPVMGGLTGRQLGGGNANHLAGYRVFDMDSRYGEAFLSAVQDDL